MRAPAVSFAKRFVAAMLMALLLLSLAPADSFAEGESDAADAPAEDAQEVDAVWDEEDAEASPISSVAPAAASKLAEKPSSLVSADVSLDGEPVIGSFTVDGLTFAVAEGSNVQLVGVAAVKADASAIVLPESIAYNDVEYSVTSVGSYAFYLSDVTSVELPVSVTEVDDSAFRSSDVASVEVAEGNPSYSSFDGALYGASQSSLLLIPEGKQGTVLLRKTTEIASPSVFSHCPLVTQISVEEGSAAFASENGLLYDASLTTLLRVPAGATEITIREGCTTISAGAMEACASLATINAPASIMSISPYLFEQQPETVMAPVAVAAVEGGSDDGLGGEGALLQDASQLMAMVALSSTDDELPSLDADNIMVKVPVNADCQIWEAMGFETEPHEAQQDSTTPEPVATAQSSSTYALASGTYKIIACSIDDGGYFQTNTSGFGTYPGGSSFTQGVNESGATVSFSAAAVDPSTGNSSITYTATSGSETKTLRVIAFPGVGYEVAGYRINGSPTLVPSYSAYITGATQSVHVVVKKSTFLVNLDGNGADTPGTSAIYYWKNKGYIVDSDSITVIAAGSTIVPSANLPRRAGYTFAGYWSTSATSGGTMYMNASGQLTSNAPTYAAEGNTWYARWTKNAIQTVRIYMNAGDTSTIYRTVYLWYGKGWYSTSSPTDSTAQLTTIGTPTRAGYTYKGVGTSSTTTTVSAWSSPSTMPSVTYVGSASTASTYSRYVIWTANTIRITWDLGDGSAASVTSQTYSTSATVGLPFEPQREGYAFLGWWTSATDGSQVTSSTPLPTVNTTYHAHWSADAYDIVYDLDGGSVSGNPDTYDIETASFTLNNPIKRGYVFVGWSGTGLEGNVNTMVTVPQGSMGDRSYVAHWTPALSADIPLEVTARIDLLGSEEQEAAAGYIESRCGEPLEVAEVSFAPLAGAAELFGSGNVSSVFLEVLASGSVQPDARFALDAAKVQEPASSAAFHMESYEDRILVGYRFDIPDELLQVLAEATKPVCSVAYTVALVN